MARGRPKIPPEVRFERFVKRDEDTGHWLWQGALQRASGSVARFWDGEERVDPRKWAWVHFIGPIEEIMHPRRTCDDKTCVSPYHCELVSVEEMQRHGYMLGIGIDIMSRFKAGIRPMTIEQSHKCWIWKGLGGESTAAGIYEPGPRMRATGRYSSAEGDRVDANWGRSVSVSRWAYVHIAKKPLDKNHRLYSICSGGTRCVNPWHKEALFPSHSYAKHGKG